MCVAGTGGGVEEEKPQTQNRTLAFQEEKLRTDTKTGAIVLHVINSYYLSCVLPRTHACTRPTHIFSPFRLFSEVARPLSKVRVAKGRVHFHIFPFDMRRPSIQGYVFLRRFLPLPLSAPLIPPSPCPLLYTLRACLGGPGKT